MTPPSHDVQPAPCFASADVKCYQRRFEEGYDVPDPHYSSWLTLILLVPIPLRHPLLKQQLKLKLQLPMMSLGHLAKLATVGIQERACGLPATGLRDGITASVLKYRSRQPSPRPTHALLAPRHAIDHLHNHVSAHSLAFSMHDRRPSFYPCPNIYNFQYSRRWSVAEKKTSSKVRPWAGREYA